MYIPGKYLPLLIVHHLSLKEALLAINTKAVAQNKQDTLTPLIDWIRVAVTCSAAELTMHSSMVHSAMPLMPLMEPAFATKQKTIVAGDLPGWNCTNAAGGGTPGQPQQPLGGLGGGTTNTVLQSLQLLIQQSQMQGNLMPMRCIKKPSKHWEGTIDLLLHLVGINAEDNLSSGKRGQTVTRRKHAPCYKSTYGIMHVTLDCQSLSPAES
jgi:hypothetical protein